MDYRTDFKDLSKPGDAAKLSSILAELADSLDVLLSTTAPDGNISGRQGQICLYNNSGTYTVWINTTGSTVWQQVDASGMQYTDTRHKMVQATRDLTTASGTQEITGAGFAPKGVIIIGGIDSGLPNTWGIAESGGTLWSMGICQDFKMAIVNGSVIIAVQGNYLTPYQNATVSSWDSDGITLSWTKVGAPTGTLTFACYFLR